MKKVLVVLLLASSVSVNVLFSLEVAEMRQSLKICKKRIDCQKIRVDGASMQPTLMDKQEVVVCHKKPKVGDIIAFSCDDKKCGYAYQKLLIKRLVKKNKKCYWFEGDNKQNSYDARNFGWLCGDDLLIYGVVSNQSF